MKENSIYDRKSLRSVVGIRADFGELAKDCVAFSNAQGGKIDIGIEDRAELPPEGQRLPDGLAATVVNRISGLTNGVVLTAEVLTADNGGEYLRLNIPRNPNAVSVTSRGQIFIRIGDLQERIGQEIPYKKVWQQLQGLVDEGRVRRAGTNRWTRYELIE